MVHLEVLAALVVVLCAVGVFLASVFATHAPAASLALMGLIAGGAAGFAVEAADGPKGVPATVAVWASAGLGLGGLIGLVAARGRPPARSARRAAIWTLAVAPFAGVALTLTLWTACPLYVMGKKSSYCNYEGVDVLGAWVSEVVFLFMAGAVWLAMVLFVSAWQAGRASDPDRSPRLPDPPGLYSSNACSRMS
jgi:hypothetical protein